MSGETKSNKGIGGGTLAGTFMDEFGGSLVNLLLGAMLLWIGQTTFEHAGQLAGIRQQISAGDSRHDALRQRCDDVVSAVNDRTKSRFTAEDGEKLSRRLNQVEIAQDIFKDKIHERFGALRVQVSALEVQLRTAIGSRPEAPDQNRWAALNAEVASLRREMASLGRALGYGTSTSQSQPVQSADWMRTSGVPQYAPYVLVPSQQAHPGAAHAPVTASEGRARN